MQLIDRMIRFELKAKFLLNPLSLDLKICSYIYLLFIPGLTSHICLTFSYSIYRYKNNDDKKHLIQYILT